MCVCVCVCVCVCMELGREGVGIIIGDAQSFVKLGMQGMKKDLSWFSN